MAESRDFCIHSRKDIFFQNKEHIESCEICRKKLKNEQRLLSFIDRNIPLVKLDKTSKKLLKKEIFSIISKLSFQDESLLFKKKNRVIKWIKQGMQDFYLIVFSIKGLFIICLGILLAVFLSWVF